MAVNLEIPPALSGESEEQLKQMYSYLYRLSESLNVALNNLTYDDIHASGSIRRDSDGKVIGNTYSVIESLSESYNELRALITNTASFVKSEEDRITQTMEAKYQSISNDWGNFREGITSTMEATARSVVTSYNYDSELNTLKEKDAGFSQYKLHTESFIRQGFIDYDSAGAPVIGIAIGQNLKSYDVTVGGEQYTQIDSTQSCAFYTADRVSFRVNGQEVAYISNNKLYITDADIRGNMVYGDWMVTQDFGGFAIKWIGD